MGVRTALFDLDGTLINSEHRSLAMWQMLLDRYGSDADVRIFMGRRSRDVLPHVLPGHDAEKLIAEVFAFGSEPGLPAIEPVPGAHAFVTQVAAVGSPIAVVTSAGMEWAEERLVELGVRDLVRTIVAAGDVAVGKPDPAGFLLASRRLSVEAADCVVFEDSLPGVVAAKAAGMRCVGVATSHTAEELAGADLVVPDLSRIAWPPFR